MTLQSLTRRMPLSIALGVLVVFALSVSSDATRLLQVLARFDWAIVPYVIGLTLVNYCLRFLKWQYYLRVVGISSVPVAQSATIFVAGLSMVITPGKVGELLKSYLLRHHRGVPIGKSAPIIVAERLTDGIAMILLASVGLLTYRVGFQILIPILTTVIVVLIVSRIDGSLDGCSRLPSAFRSLRRGFIISKPRSKAPTIYSVCLG